MASAQWLEEENGENKIIDLDGVRRILIKAQDVEMVELMEAVTDVASLERAHGRSESTYAPAAAADARAEGHVTRPAAAVPAAATAPTAGKEIAEENMNGRQQSAEPATCAPAGKAD
jgi:hypothetical protein